MRKTKILLLCFVLIIASMGTVWTVSAMNSGQGVLDPGAQKEWMISDKAYSSVNVDALSEDEALEEISELEKSTFNETERGVIEEAMADGKVSAADSAEGAQAPEETVSTAPDKVSEAEAQKKPPEESSEKTASEVPEVPEASEAQGESEKPEETVTTETGQPAAAEQLDENESTPLLKETFEDIVLPVGGVEKPQYTISFDDETEPRMFRSGVTYNYRPADDYIAIDETRIVRNAKSKLTGSKLAMYNAIAEGIKNHSTSISIPYSGSWDTLGDELVEVSELVRADHAEYFWYSGWYGISTSGSNVYLKPTYYTEADYGNRTLEEAKKVFDEGLISITKGLEGKDDYEKAKAVHDRIISLVIYKIIDNGGKTPNINQSAYSVFSDNHYSVCAGYAKAYQAAMNYLGVNAWYVSGIGYTGTGSGPHAWNVVQLDGKWYCSDVTWDDCNTDLNNDGNVKQYQFDSRYTYFNVTREFLDTDHKVDADSEPYMPVCDSTDASMGKKEGVVASDINIDVVKAAFAKDSRTLLIWYTGKDTPDVVKQKVIDACDSLNALGYKFYIQSVSVEGNSVKADIGLYSNRRMSGTAKTFLDSNMETQFNFYDKSNTKVGSFSEYGNDAKVEFYLPNGTYTMEVSKPNHVTRRVDVTVSGGVVSNSSTTLHLLGDVDGDGEIGFRDYLAGLEHIGGKYKLEGYSFDCLNVSTNDDGITFRDVFVMLEHISGKYKLW